MAHPHAAHRQNKVEHSRVAHITKGYASGGAVHGEDAEFRTPVKGMVKKTATRMHGGAAKQRADKPHRARGGRTQKKADGGTVAKLGQEQVDQLDRWDRGEKDADQSSPSPAGRARGGRTSKKGGKTVVNVINAGGHPAAGAMPMGAAGPPSGPMPMPMPPPGGPPMPPRPMPGPGGPMAGAAPGMPPGMPPRKAGGRAYKDGGRVADGPAWKEGRAAGTQVTHSPGKNDQAGLNRGRQITYKNGGKVESPEGVASATKLPGGSGGGEARLAKERRAARDYKRA